MYILSSVKTVTIATVLLLGPVDVTQIAANFVSNKADVIIRMRGLPFNTKETEVVSCSS